VLEIVIGFSNSDIPDVYIWLLAGAQKLGGRKIGEGEVVGRSKPNMIRDNVKRSRFETKYSPSLSPRPSLKKA
jgi:hypothetical protein